MNYLRDSWALAVPKGLEDSNVRELEKASLTAAGSSAMGTVC
jgi:hypothetical protein